MPTTATTTATAITWAVAVGIMVIGARFLWTPQRAATDFGLRTTGPTAAVSSWLSVKGVRDICSGLFLLIVLLGGDVHLRGWMMLAGSLIALGDAFTVRRGGGPATAYYGIHGGTAAVMAAAGITLLLS
ncbi:DUF4267 domain-containing protein [Streptomyces griseoluteus]|uniref:DUF4267 domain-containing protein n=1 Tax=Streptomyces griseoluteus TaxID=29306 RepID=UPI00382B535F